MQSISSSSNLVQGSVLAAMQPHTLPPAPAPPALSSQSSALLSLLGASIMLEDSQRHQSLSARPQQRRRNSAPVLPPSPLDEAKTIKQNRALSRATKHSKKNLRFLILLRILISDLERSGEHQLKMRVKHVVQECNRRRRNGDTTQLSLETVVETALKVTVGSTRWNLAKQKLDIMMLQRKQRLCRTN